MRAIRDGDPDAGLVIAAQGGDRAALDALLGQYLPLLYNIVGRALNGHADVDDVVQETMLRAVRSIRDVRDPAAFRSWLVAIAVRKIRDHVSGRPLTLAGHGAPEVADPGADFVDLTIMRLGLSGQRRETAEATRWLDGEDRDLLALWWQEAAGTLDRGAVAAGLGMTPAHTAVRIGRMKERLTTARLVVRALQARPACDELAEVIAPWDGAPSPLWRKRIARHARDCRRCQARGAGLIPAEQLLNGLPLLPAPLLALPAAVRALLSAPAASAHPGPAATHPAPAGPQPGLAGPQPGLAGPRHSAPLRHAARPRGSALHHLRVLPKAVATLQPKIVVATIAATAAVAGGAVAVAHAQSARPTQVVPVAAPARPVSTAPGPAPSPVPSKPPRPSQPAPRPPTHPAVPPPAAPPPTGLLKGVGAWNFTGATAALAQSRASWYFTWSTSPDGIASPPGVAFVPDIWGQATVTPAALAQARQAGHYLLTFNEPDSGAQANMTVAQALADWPQLEQTGMLLGSPAVQDDAATPGSWLDQFMSGAKARGYRVDFIVVHWYAQGFDPAASVSELKAYLQAIYQRYHLPIWLTEFGMVKFGSPATYPSDAQQSAFLTGAATMMAGLPYVQRYAWFALPVTTGPTGDGNLGLFASGPVVTPEGRAFEAAAGR
jgi:RNA polymerase sigma factor (sigma-70 family)